ncbi:MAG: sigma factor-like helix-turn-helix DNA-binding protein [bacterium]|nr:sigma factor-like helix-turn-helix DNA-binding protein [bacterium]
MTKQIEITIRARNNLLIEARTRFGFANQAAAGRAIGLSAVGLNGLECFRTSPIGKKTGTWTGTAQRIADFYGVEPGELWPQALIELRGSPQLTVYLEAHELSGSTRLALPSSTVAEEHELTAMIDKVLKTINERDALVIRARLGLGDDEGPMTLDECAEKFGVTRERVRQLWMRGIRRIQDQSQTDRLLSDYFDEVGG